MERITPRERVLKSINFDDRDSPANDLGRMLSTGGQRGRDITDESIKAVLGAARESGH